MQNENDPTGRSPHEAGAKLDAGKVQASVLEDFGLALGMVAKVGTGGVHKYTRNGWEEVPDGILRYKDALWRHLLEMRYSKIDPGFGLPHLAHLAWNALAILELSTRLELESSNGSVEELMGTLTPEILRLAELKNKRNAVPPIIVNNHTAEISSKHERYSWDD